MLNNISFVERSNFCTRLPIHENMTSFRVSIVYNRSYSIKKWYRLRYIVDVNNNVLIHWEKADISKMLNWNISILERWITFHYIIIRIYLYKTGKFLLFYNWKGISLTIGIAEDSLWWAGIFLSWLLHSLQLPRHPNRYRARSGKCGWPKGSNLDACTLL